MTRQPALFVAHGSPMVAIQDDGWSRALSSWGKAAPRPKAIVAISAHWESRAPARVSSSPRPGVIHDFGGFPDALYELDYPAPGDPALAGRIVELLNGAFIAAESDPARGLDHGVWVPLRFLHPAADIPVVEISLPIPRPATELLALGAALAPLRDEGVLLMGSGGIVHNLRRLDWEHKDGATPGWAREFDGWIAAQLAGGDHDALADYRTRAPHPELAVPTTEHFDPLLVIAGAAGGHARPGTLFTGFHHGSLSMRSVVYS